MAEEGLLALVSPPRAGGSWDQVLYLGTTAKQAAVPAMLPAAEPPAYKAQHQLPYTGATGWVAVPSPDVAGQ